MEIKRTKIVDKILDYLVLENGFDFFPELPITYEYNPDGIRIWYLDNREYRRPINAVDLIMCDSAMSQLFGTYLDYVRFGKRDFEMLRHKAKEIFPYKPSDRIDYDDRYIVEMVEYETPFWLSIRLRLLALNNYETIENKLKEYILRC